MPIMAVAVNNTGIACDGSTQFGPDDNAIIDRYGQLANVVGGNGQTGGFIQAATGFHGVFDQYLQLHAAIALKGSEFHAWPNPA